MQLTTTEAKKRHSFNYFEYFEATNLLSMRHVLNSCSP